MLVPGIVEVMDGSTNSSATMSEIEGCPDEVCASEMHVPAAVEVNVPVAVEVLVSAEVARSGAGTSVATVCCLIVELIEVWLPWSWIEEIFVIFWSGLEELRTWERERRNVKLEESIYRSWRQIFYSEEVGCECNSTMDIRSGGVEEFVGIRVWSQSVQIASYIEEGSGLVILRFQDLWDLSSSGCLEVAGTEVVLL
jgi:hypothetical protein